ncbi:amidase family protein [uncultured Limimaricola sp.]|uniref:amidase family protein n=1 Tax=uncultured Limimaricola sp. TaxID=2211667 RepID=UPI0030FBCAD4
MSDVMPPNFTQSFAVADVPEGPLSGLKVGIKDLFDVAGYVTKAGSRARADQPAATCDAEVVARLRAAGATLVGHTNMTEFAYSGLGLNPHFGTPLSPIVEGAIAGGSTSGGAAALACAQIDIALGTDTGGSLRIPAAFCGVVGMKPTAAIMPSKGATALSHTLDSVGAMARDVATLRRAHEVLADPGTQAITPLRRLIVPQSFGMTDLDPAVAAAFDTCLSTLAGLGFAIEHRDPAFLNAYARLPIWQFAAVESRVHHAGPYEQSPELIDPRVKARMDRADEVDAVTYAKTLALRIAIVEEARAELGDAAIVLPTVAILPPQLSVFNDPAVFDRLNLLALRNTSLANVIDGCSISLPITSTPGAGLMLTAPGYRDHALLDAAERIAPHL